MNRVAIHLPSSPAVDPTALRDLFREVQQAGGRVVVVAQEVDDTNTGLRNLIRRLGDDFDRLFSLVGVDLFEWLPSDQPPEPISPPAEAYH